MNIYFIATSSAVKIGVAKDVKKRMADLQCSNSEALTVLGSFPVEHGTDPFKVEKALHSKFKAFHLRGEWFKRVSSIELLACQGDGTLHSVLYIKSKSKNPRVHALNNPVLNVSLNSEMTLEEENLILKDLLGEMFLYIDEFYDSKNKLDNAIEEYKQRERDCFEVWVKAGRLKERLELLNATK